MCATCREINRVMAGGGATAAQVFKLIEAAVAAGAKPEHFKAATDKLLGTEMPARDRDAEERWEGSYQRTRRGGDVQ